MNYTSFSLNGAWEMQYQEEKYTDKVSPFAGKSFGMEDAAGTEPEDMSNSVVEGAVPGYWEDMTEKFMLTPFFRELRINPEYGLQQYPMAGAAPDMALPNIIGNFFYRRNFNCEEITNPAVIHFEGVQNSASVWINDVFLGRHEGYSTPFDMEIPAGTLKNGANEIVISVSNHRLEGYAGEPVSGLTSRAANECTGGITGDVELRVYNCDLRDAAILVSEDCKKVSVFVESTKKTSFCWAVYDGEVLVKKGDADGNFDFDTEGLSFWSPESPKLYTLEIAAGEGSIVRQFGVRRLLADGVHFKLNGKPYYLRGICEHCYFPETIHPNHDYTYYRSMIKAIKNLGFNFVRFHTFVPEEEYMQAADELGILLHVESPNNTTLEEWEQIVKFARRHTSVVIYCCGNELLMDEPFIDHLHKCGDCVHQYTDSLFSPMNAMRGLEYFWVEPDQEPLTKELPFKHHPGRIANVSQFSDFFSSYPNGVHSYFSLDANPEMIDEWSKVYNKPRVSHEICIDGTYTDLSLKPRYKGTRVGKTDMFDSIERHLEEKGVLKNAPTYFKNSSEWQRRMRKYCFEATRRSNNMAGYDFLGPIDTHWHTFGYDVGMMNEFYELKPGETQRNVLMYNGATVLLTDLDKKVNYASGDTVKFNAVVSYFGEDDLKGANLAVRLTLDGKVIARGNRIIENIVNGQVSNVANFEIKLPEVIMPGAMKLSMTLDGGETFAENEWELYIFPKADNKGNGNVVVLENAEISELEKLLSEGRDVLLMGAQPFPALPTSFRLSLAGRTSGNSATVLHDHPVLRNMPNEGFCGWQFWEMLEGGKTICFDNDKVPFSPIVEVVSTHKYVVKQASLFELNAAGGRLMVCGLNMKESDPAASWFKSEILAYMNSDKFNPQNSIDADALRSFASTKVIKTAANNNLAFNPNDKTAVRKKK